MLLVKYLVRVRHTAAWCARRFTSEGVLRFEPSFLRMFANQVLVFRGRRVVISYLWNKGSIVM